MTLYSWLVNSHYISHFFATHCICIVLYCDIIKTFSYDYISNYLFLHTYLYPIDEIDGLVTNRDAASGSSSSGDSNSAESRVLATLLTEMDGILNNNPISNNTNNNNNSDDSDDDIVYIFATTNRLDSIDVALLRKVGRLVC